LWLVGKVQHHPEALPGTQNSDELFRRFMNMVAER